MVSSRFLQYDQNISSEPQAALPTWAYHSPIGGRQMAWVKMTFVKYGMKYGRAEDQTHDLRIDSETRYRLSLLSSAVLNRVVNLWIACP